MPFSMFLAMLSSSAPAGPLVVEEARRPAAGHVGAMAAGANLGEQRGGGVAAPASPTWPARPPRSPWGAAGGGRLRRGRRSLHDEALQGDDRPESKCGGRRGPGESHARSPDRPRASLECANIIMARSYVARVVSRLLASASASDTARSRWRVHGGRIPGGCGLRDADELRVHGFERNHRPPAGALTFRDGRAPGAPVHRNLDRVCDAENRACRGTPPRPRP